MDVFSHGLWGAVYAKAKNEKLEKKLSFGWAFWWGMFPDLFAFGPIFIYSFYLKIIGKPSLLHGPVNDIEPWTPSLHSFSDVTQLLYSFSHSFIILALIAVLVYAITKKTPWILGGWLIHVLLDIPSHSYAFYATPVLFPITGWKFNGWAWGLHWWVEALNYGSMLAIYLYLKFRKPKPYPTSP